MYRYITRALILTLALGIGGPVASQSDTVHIKRYNDGGVYKGTFRHGQQHGSGTYTLPNGYEYSGEWVNGEIRGTGMARFPNGSVYKGEFAMGQPNGIGKITFKDGGTYEGSWRDGKITGTGTAIYANGVRYKGSFLNAKHHGRGRMESPSGHVYDGEWVNGVREGNASIIYPDGSTYEGNVSQGARDGQGTVTMRDGMVYTGLWSDDEIASLDTPNFRKIIDRLDFIGAAEKAATTELLQTAYTLIGGMEPDGTAALLGISSGDFAADFLGDPKAMLAVAGSDIIRSAGEAAFAEAAGDIVEEYMFKAGPLSELPDEWQVPLRALVDATIVESIGLLTTGTDPTGASLVGPIVDRLNNVHAIYQATNELSRAQALGLFAIANGADITAELVRKHPSEKTEQLKVDWLEATRENISGIVGADDAGAAYNVTVLGFSALDAQGRGDIDTAKGEIEKMLAIGDAAQGLTPLSAEGPIDLLVRLASGGNDAPKVLAEVFLKSTSLKSLNPDSNNASLQGAMVELNGVRANDGGDNTKIYDIYDISRLEMLSIAHTSGTSWSQISSRLPWEKSNNDFQNRRNRKKAEDEFVKFSNSAQFQKIAIFHMASLPTKISRYDFEKKRFLLCLPSVVESSQMGYAGVRLAVVPHGRINNPHKCDKIIIDQIGPSRVFVSMQNTISIPMPNINMAERLDKIATSNYFYLNVDCAKDEKLQKLGYRQNLLISCSPTSVQLVAGNRTLLKISYGSEGASYDYQF